MKGADRRPTILVTGRDGQVGFELVRALAPLGEIRAVDVGDVDLCAPSAVRDLVRETKPSLVVNPAAYTAVDKAESDVDTARAVNALAPGSLAEEAARLDVPIVHFSVTWWATLHQDGSVFNDKMQVHIRDASMQTTLA